MYRRSRRWRTGARALLALTMVCGALAVGAGASATASVASASADDGHTVKGYLSLQDSAVFVGKVCQGAGGYTDLGEGTPVVVRDGDGEIIGTGHFSAGKGAGGGRPGPANVPSACVFAFTVRHVPDTSTYSFRMSHRGGVVYTHDELEESNWKIGAALTPSARAEVVVAV
jgi:hypothetical protein